jgi:hypothetical protein
VREQVDLVGGMRPDRVGELLSEFFTALGDYWTRPYVSIVHFRLIAG